MSSKPRLCPAKESLYDELDGFDFLPYAPVDRSIRIVEKKLLLNAPCPLSVDTVKVKTLPLKHL